MNYVRIGCVYLSLLLLTATLAIATHPEVTGHETGSLDLAAAAVQPIALDPAQQPKPDTLSNQSWWQDKVKAQVKTAQNQQIEHCLFGDSISSMLGDSLGDSVVNFAIGGMSSVSLLDQLNQLMAAGVQCKQVIIAMGTNDADYQITNDQFVSNMQQAIALSRQMKANQIVLLPAFYSTVAASHDIAMAGPISRVNEINRLLQQVAASEKVMITKGVNLLYDGEALKENLTIDGVHLNDAGLVIYRNALLQIMDLPPF